MPLRRRDFNHALSAAAILGAPAWQRPARAASGRRLTAWFTVEGSKAMRRIGERFTADTGVEVIVETPDPQEGPTKFQQASAAGKGPDIYVYAHDRIGEWIGGGLLHAVHPSARLLGDIDPLAWKGFTRRGRIWGYPYALEAVTLVYNKALVRAPPKTFDEVFSLDRELAQQGRKAILWDYTNTYFSWPLFAANGAYAFRERADGSFDAHDSGVDKAGALIGALLLDRLLREGLMPPGSGYPEMEAAVAQGRVAMMINGPWSWVSLRRAGIDFGVAKIPSVAGKAALPFVGVKGIVINRATKQRELAVEFIENHLLAPAGLRAIDQAESIGAPASRAYLAERVADARDGERIAGIVASARDGVITPNVPEMGRFWATMKTALTNLSEGRQTPAEALAAAAQRLAS